MQNICYFVTTNKNKFERARKSLNEFNIPLEQIDIELTESRAENPKDIVREKAEQVFDKLQKPSIVEDSGFFIDSLGGFPMTHIKFSLATLGIGKILKAMKGDENRHAEWRMASAYVDEDGKIQIFEFIEKGEVSYDIRKNLRGNEASMSEYWKIFIPSEANPNRLALSEMTGRDLEIQMDFFHRNNHFTKLGEWLSSKSQRS